MTAAPLHPRCGALVGEAACFSESACQNLVAMAVGLDAAGLEVSPDLAGLIENVCEAASAMVQLADEFGAAMVTRARRLQSRQNGTIEGTVR